MPHPQLVAAFRKKGEQPRCGTGARVGRLHEGYRQKPSYQSGNVWGWQWNTTEQDERPLSRVACGLVAKSKAASAAASMGMGARAARRLRGHRPPAISRCTGRGCGKGKRDHPLQEDEEHHD